MPGDTSGEIDYADMRLPGDTDAVAEMLLDEAVSLSLEPRVPVDADDEFVTTDAKDALAQDTKDAVAAEPEQPAGQARVHNCSDNGPPASSAPPAGSVSVAKVLGWAVLPLLSLPRLGRTWRRVQPSSPYHER